MKFIKEKKILIIIISIIIVISVVLIVFLATRGSSEGYANSYDFDDEVVELPDTNTYENEQLASKHCLNNICIENVVFYYNDNTGRIEYDITNTSNEVKSGYLKMVFNDASLTIAYKDIGPKKTVKSRTQYTGKEIKDKSDYSLRKLTNSEKSKIKK